MSANLPKGTRDTAAAKRYEVATQLNKTASVLNSFPMAGSAILTDEIINGVKKELNDAMIRADNLMALSFIEKILGEWQRGKIEIAYFVSQSISTNFSTFLNSGSPVKMTAFSFWAVATTKQSAKESA